MRRIEVQHSATAWLARKRIILQTETFSWNMLEQVGTKPDHWSWVMIFWCIAASKRTNRSQEPPPAMPHGLWRGAGPLIWWTLKGQGPAYVYLLKMWLCMAMLVYQRVFLLGKASYLVVPSFLPYANQPILTTQWAHLPLFATGIGWHKTQSFGPWDCTNSLVSFVHMICALYPKLKGSCSYTVISYNSLFSILWNMLKCKYLAVMLKVLKKTNQVAIFWRDLSDSSKTARVVSNLWHGLQGNHDFPKHVSRYFLRRD